MLHVFKITDLCMVMYSKSGKSSCLRTSCSVSGYRDRLRCILLLIVTVRSLQNLVPHIFSFFGINGLHITQICYGEIIIVIVII